jgi:ACR3 family arsenite transporter
VFKAFITPELATQYLAGTILLGAAPCTAMVFVWSHLTRGNPAYTVVQVATNDLIILVAFIPIVKLLLGVSNIAVPWSTLILSVVLFVVIPLAAGILTRIMMTKKRGLEYFENTFLKKFDNLTTIGLLLMLVLLFSFQGETIINNPLHILLIAVPLTIQTFLIFFIAYLAGRKLKLTHDIAAPAGMIGASNFFELSVAVAIALFGMDSPAALATVVGVLTEVPVMLILVKIANNTSDWFPQGVDNNK